MQTLLMLVAGFALLTMIVIACLGVCVIAAVLLDIARELVGQLRTRPRLTRERV